MADKVLAWGVVCGSGERAGKLHVWYDGDLAICAANEQERPESWVRHWAKLDAGVESFPGAGECGKHRVVALVERPEEVKS